MSGEKKVASRGKPLAYIVVGMDVLYHLVLSLVESEGVLSDWEWVRVFT